MQTGVATGCVVLGLTAAIVLCARPLSRAAGSDSGPLRVTAKLLTRKDYQSEHAPSSKAYPYFELRCTVTNISGKPQRFSAFNCSWDWNWHTDNPQIRTPGWPCFRNFAETIELAPGERYEKVLPLTAAPKVWGKKIRLRVGFSTHPQYYPRPGRNIPVIWSPPLSIKVSRPATSR